MPAYGLKKNTKLDHWFWNLFDATQVRSGSFEGVRTGRKVRPPKGPHTWEIWGHASSKKF